MLSSSFNLANSSSFEIPTQAFLKAPEFQDNLSGFELSNKITPQSLIDYRKLVFKIRNLIPGHHPQLSKRLIFFKHYCSLNSFYKALLTLKDAFSQYPEKFLDKKCKK